MDNFDLKKYLVENKVTRNSRMLTEQADREAKKPKHSRMMKEVDDWQEVAMQQHNEYLEDILADLEKEKGIRPDVNIGWSIDDEDSISSKIYSNPTSIFTTYHNEDGSIFTTDLEGGDMGEAKKPKHSRMMKEANQDLSNVKWNYPDVDIIDNIYYEPNQESDTFSVQIPVTGVKPDGEIVKGLYIAELPDLSQETLDDLDIDPKFIYIDDRDMGEAKKPKSRKG